MNIKKGYASQVDQLPWVSCRWAFEPSCYGSQPWHSSSCPSSRTASCSSSELEPSILSSVPSSPIGLPSSKFLSFFNFSDLIWDLEMKGSEELLVSVYNGCILYCLVRTVSNECCESYCFAFGSLWFLCDWMCYVVLVGYDSFVCMKWSSPVAVPVYMHSDV